MKKRILCLITTLVMVVGLVGVMPTVNVGAYDHISYNTQKVQQGKNGCNIASIAVVALWSGKLTNASTAYNDVLSYNGSTYVYNKTLTKYDLAVSNDLSINNLYSLLQKGPVIIGEECGGSTHFATCIGYNGSTSSLTWGGFIIQDTKQKSYRLSDGKQLTSNWITNLADWKQGSKLKNFKYYTGSKPTIPTPPAAPNVTINRTVGTSSDTISVSWSAVSGATSYWLHIYKDGKDYINKSIGSALSYSNTFPNGKYWMTITSCNSVGENGTGVDFAICDYYNESASFYATIKCVGTGKYLTCSNTTNQTNFDDLCSNVEASGTSVNNETIWEFTRKSSGYYAISNYATKKLLDVYCVYNYDGANVEAHKDYNGGVGQMWKLYKTDNSYIMQARGYSTRVLDIAGNITNAIIYTYNNTNAQRFIITEVSEPHSHSYSTTVISPTSTSQGYTLHTCTICGDSYKDNYTNYKPTDISMGDINNDGKITTADVGLANAHAKGTKLLNDEQFKRGDVNKDGIVSTADVGLINAYAKGTKTYS